MSTINASASNLSARVLSFKGLGLGATLVIPAATVDLESGDVNAFGARTCLLLVKLAAAGDLTVKAEINSGTPSFTSPTVTVGSLTDTNQHCSGLFNTSATNPYVALHLSSTAGSTVDETGFFLQIGSLIADGSGYHESKMGMCGVLDGTYSVQSSATNYISQEENF